MKLFIFDMGGVVCENTRVLPYIEKHLQITGKEFLTIADVAGLDLLQGGGITAEEFWRNFSREYGQEVTEELWGKYFQPTRNEQTIAIIRELQKTARVVVGTNTIEPHYVVHERRGDYAIFDAIYASHRIGYVKPDPEFYRHILKAEQCEPADAVFIDDLEKNVQAAAGLGIRGIQFVGAEALREVLFPQSS